MSADWGKLMVGFRTGRTTGVFTLLGACLITALAVPDFLAMRHPDRIVTGPGVTRTTLLSEYFPKLAGTPGTLQSI